MQRKNAHVDPDGKLPKEFPLTSHPNGQYSKKHAQRPYYFGRIADGWRLALERFNHDWPYILADQVPPPMGTDTTTVEYVARMFLARSLKRLERGQLSGGSFVDIRVALGIAATSLGRAKNVRHLRPSDFADLRDALGCAWVFDEKAGRWVRQESRLGPATLKRRIIHVRAMFRWAVDERILAERPSYGDEFKLVSDRTLRKSLAAAEREHGAKRWEPSEILPIFNALDQQLQAAFLLTINCGLTAADCSALPWRAVNLDEGYIDFPRVKTGIDRLRMPLWPETVQALRHVRAMDLKAAPGLAERVVFQDKGDNGEPIGQPVRLKECVFITRFGRNWVRRTLNRDSAGVPVCESHRDSFAEEFAKALKRNSLKRPRCGFGTGRHTFESNALRVADKGLVDAVMGHSTGAMSQRYDHAMEQDLKAMVEGVRRRLLVDAKWRQSAADPAPAAVRLAS